MTSALAAAALALAAATAAVLLLPLLALSRRVAEMEQVARRLADGDYAARVRDAGGGAHGRLGAALNTLAAAVEDAFNELSRDKAQLESILATVVEAVAAVGPDGRVLAVNPALCELFGVDARGSIERPFVEALRNPHLTALVSAVLKEGAPRVEEIALLTPEERVFEAHAVPLQGEAGPHGALLVLHDITRVRRLEGLRREFVANVSHELRTPLASIRATAETLRDGAIDDREHRGEFLEAIEKDAERLSALVDDLLELSAIESGQRKPRKTSLSLAALAREAAASMAALARRRGVELRVSGDDHAVSADADQLRRALLNLLDNAIKFNRDKGWIELATRAAEGQAELVVRDSGIGIAEEDLPRVFERFFRADKARSTGGGTGLGLSIVKHIAEAHGGAVTVESRLGEGSTFRITLPLRS